MAMAMARALHWSKQRQHCTSFSFFRRRTVARCSQKKVHVNLSSKKKAISKSSHSFDCKTILFARTKNAHTYETEWRSPRSNGRDEEAQPMHTLTHHTHTFHYSSLCTTYKRLTTASPRAIRQVFGKEINKRGSVR